MNLGARVSIFKAETACYPEVAPYYPSQPYPELATLSRHIQLGSEPNSVYEAVRGSLYHYGLDAARFGTPDWNPLGEWIQPGNRVVIKPNLVLHETNRLVGTHCLTTHGSVIRAIADYACLALRGRGRLTIADAPLQSARFDAIQSTAGLLALQRFYRQETGLEVELLDLRQICAIKDDRTGYISKKELLLGDPRGYAVIDLANTSAFERPDARHLDPARFAVSDYSATETRARHAPDKHEYVIARSILEADVLISAPKFKVHEKVGLTTCLKGMVGVVGSKDCLPHFSVGAPSEGGDEFADEGRLLSTTWSAVRTRAQGRVPLWLWRLLRSGGKGLSRVILSAQRGFHDPENGVVRKPITGGAWYGNDTTWRMVDDLNRIVRYATPDGRLQAEPPRRIFAVVDGIVAGEGSGPLEPSPHPMGLIICGANLWAADVVCAALAGMDWQCLPMLRQSVWRGHAYAGASDLQHPVDIELCSNQSEFADWSTLLDHTIPLQPPPGWIGYVEIAGRAAQ